MLLAPLILCGPPDNRDQPLHPRQPPPRYTGHRPRGRPPPSRVVSRFHRCGLPATSCLRPSDGAPTAPMRRRTRREHRRAAGGRTHLRGSTGWEAAPRVISAAAPSATNPGGGSGPSSRGEGTNGKGPGSGCGLSAAFVVDCTVPRAWGYRAFCKHAH